MAQEVFKVKVEGAKELADLFTELETDFGEKATKQVLTQAVRKSMRPALDRAKQLVPKDTEELMRSLQIEARKPNRKDRRSKYVSKTDVAVAFITTAPKRKLVSIRRSIKMRDAKAAAKAAGMAFDAKAWRQNFDSDKERFDGRAIAREFGTAKQAATPYLRPGLESTSQTVVNLLGDEVKKAISVYKAKNSK